MIDKPLKALKAIAGAPNKPLKIGDVEIGCYVLDNKVRVLTQRGLTAGLGLRSGGGSSGVGNKIPRFFTSKTLKEFIPDELKEQLNNPIEFTSHLNGGKCFGYRATVLPDICNVVLDARDKGALISSHQERVAEQCNILIRGLAGLAMIALVDEATGYQYIRESNALEKILDKFLLDHARKWAKTFPDEFWGKLLKAKGYSQYHSMKRPAFVGHWVNELVYDRLAIGVLKKLRKINPKNEKGYRRDKHHQFLTENHGVPELKEHLVKLMALMEASVNPKDFDRLVVRVFGERSGQQILDI